MLNRVLLIGHLGATPELKTTQRGLAYARLSVAVSESFFDKQSGQRVENTTWVSVLVYDKTAENCCKFLQKGSSVFVEGKLQQDGYEDPQTGKKVYKTYVKGSNVQFLSKRDGGQQQQQYQPQPQQYPQPQQRQQAQQQLVQEVGGFEDNVPF